MFRILLTTLAPVLVLGGLFWLWLWVRAYYMKTHDNQPPPVEKAVWGWVVVVGVLVGLGGLLAGALVSAGGKPTDLYVPPQEVDGRVIPGHFIENGKGVLPPDESDPKSDPETSPETSPQETTGQ